ncbi:MAG TPA: phosphate ABC transporter permease PstA [Thermoanaerobaculia bacterium]
MQQTQSGLRWRKIRGKIMEGAATLCAIVAIIPLFAFLWQVIKNGAGAISWAFFTQLPQPPGETGGGLKNAMVGSLILVAVATIMGTPVGIGAAVYLTEFARPKVRSFVRFWTDVLSGVPSIVIGLLGYELIVRPVKHFSAFSGSFALACILLPILVITTQEMLQLVPGTLREAGHALGIPAWQVAWSVSLRAAAPGVLTGLLLAISRIPGETAPLIFTAFGNNFFSTSLKDPIGSLPQMIYTYAQSPYDDWHQQAWGGALVLISFILFITLFGRLTLWMRSRKQHAPARVAKEPK